MLAAEPHCVCGVDVTSPGNQEQKHQRRTARKEKSMDEQLHVFKSQLTDSERALIDRFRPDEVKMEHAFRSGRSRRFTKARGDGEIRVQPLLLSLHGARRILAADWGSTQTVAPPDSPWHSRRRCGRHAGQVLAILCAGLQDNHFISARGPPTDVIDAIGTFKASFGEELSRRSCWRSWLDEPAFVTKVERSCTR